MTAVPISHPSQSHYPLHLHSKKRPGEETALSLA